MALFKFRREMFLPYFLTYIGSVAAHIYVIGRDTLEGYYILPIFLMLPFFIQPSINSSYSEKARYDCWMCWENGQLSNFDLVDFALHLMFVSLTVIERVHTVLMSMFIMIDIAIKIVFFILGKIVHAFIVDWEMEKQYGLDKVKEIHV